MDVVFNNAGYSQAGSLEDVPTEYVKQNFETNVFGLHNLTRKSIKVMRKQGYGKIIQHSSILGLAPLKYRGSYVATKYAVEGITDSLRLELRGSNIHLITLNTGSITSNIRANSIKTAKNIEIEGSAHYEQYMKIKNNKHKPIPFNKEPAAVVNVIEKILKSSNPKPRYYITKLSYIINYAKRFMSTNILDRFLSKF